MLSCSTFTIKGVTQDAILLRLFPFSLLGKAKQWFYAIKDRYTTWDNCSSAFLAKFFPTGKTNALHGIISSIQQQHDESIPEAWEHCDRTAQFIQAQARLPPLNMLARTHLHLYKPGSPSSVMKDLGKSTSQPRSHD